MAGRLMIADAFATAVCEAFGVEPERTTRVIIDAKCGSVPKVYFDTIGDDRLLELVPSLAEGPHVRTYITNDDGEPVEVTDAA